MSQTKPSAPVTMNAECQPHLRASHTTIGGVMMAPVTAAELASPLSSARSLGGYHSETTAVDAMKLNDSPIPSRNRITPRPTEVRATACRISATDHHAVAA